MDVNEQLSPQERANMREIVLAGTQQIRRSELRRRRLIAGAVAVVLIGGTAGGAVTTAALLGNGSGPTPAVTPTDESPVPNPRPTDESPDAAPVVAFDGDCNAALTDDEVDALRDEGMTLSDYRWRTGANEVLGGIDCVWHSDELYLNATVHLYAFPEDAVPTTVQDGIRLGCTAMEADATRADCWAAGVVNGTRLIINAMGPVDQLTTAGVDELYDHAATRLENASPARAAARTPQWWEAPDCAGIADRIDPAVYGSERVELAEYQPGQGLPADRPEGMTFLAGAEFACDLVFSSGSGDSITEERVSVGIVPGGGLMFQTVVDAEGAQPVEVDGAQAAMIAPGLDRAEGSGNVLVATDGDNVLTVTPDIARNTADAAPLAAALLALMRP